MNNANTLQAASGKPTTTPVARESAVRDNDTPFNSSGKSASSIPAAVGESSSSVFGKGSLTITPFGKPATTQVVGLFGQANSSFGKSAAPVVGDTPIFKWLDTSTPIISSSFGTVDKTGAIGQGKPTPPVAGEAPVFGHGGKIASPFGKPSTTVVGDTPIFGRVDQTSPSFSKPAFAVVVKDVAVGQSSTTSPVVNRSGKPPAIAQSTPKTPPAAVFQLAIATGTAIAKYHESLGIESHTTDGRHQANDDVVVKTKQHCITAMSEYEGKSFEELRLEDYMARRKGVHHHSGGVGGSIFAASAAGGNHQRSMFHDACSNIFGQPLGGFVSPSANSSVGGVFGQAQTGGGGIFGNAAAWPRLGGFFGASMPTTNGASVFGQTSTQSDRGSIGTGSPNAFTSTGFGFFGQPSMPPQKVAPIFGSYRPPAAFDGFGTASPMRETTPGSGMSSGNIAALPDGLFQPNQQSTAGANGLMGLAPFAVPISPFVAPYNIMIATYNNVVYNFNSGF